MEFSILYDLMTKPNISQWEPQLKINSLIMKPMIQVSQLFSYLHRLHKNTITHVIMKIGYSYTFQQAMT